MKKPWQIWTAFGFCLAIVLIGMSWLTVRAIDLDQAEARARHEAELARRQSQLQERIAMALWRMDWMLTPIIAEEATRPSFVFKPFLPTVAGKGNQGNRPALASPLLTQPPQYVVLNFDVSPDNQWTSPQSPDPVDIPVALAAGVSPEAISRSKQQLTLLRDSVTYQKLLDLLPSSLLPAASFGRSGWYGEPHGSDSSIAVLNEFFQQDFSQQSSDISQAEQPASQAQPPVVPRPQDSTQRRSNAPQPGQTASQRQYAPEQLVDSQMVQSREQQEWQRRNLGMQNVALANRSQMFSNSILLPESPLEREGVSRPIWIGSKLILARRVVSSGNVRVQGCWLDWPEIKTRLRQEVTDLFPDIDLLPVTSGETVPAGRLLATLPIQLSIPASTTADTGADQVTGTSSLSAIRISLVIAWCCLMLGSLAVAVTLHGVLGLSERRASFVSAVTHELRSPLTTFRMYAEMLSEGMVRDEAQRDRYLATLRVEADRLSHLVENVLQYARLERGRNVRRRVKMDLKTLMQQTTERLPQRARQAGMELHETIAPQAVAQNVVTDPAAVEQILFNLVDNSCKYASTAEDRRIHLHWSIGNRVAQVRVTDHGPGIQAAQARKLFLPFSKSDQEAAQSAPGIGLGLALCRRLAGDIGGQLHYDPAAAEGATFLLELPLA